CCLGKLPEDIGQLESLERLVLWGTTVKHLPDSICMLKHLKFLNLRYCDLLEKLPEDLGRLICLKELDITVTGISHLPQSIVGLKGPRIVASSKLLWMYDLLKTTTSHFRPSEIKTATSHFRGGFGHRRRERRHGPSYRQAASKFRESFLCDVDDINKIMI
nr:disease resistance protein (TIR-NBS-LRR class) family [Tanacetum cinerariifolium]